MKRLIIAILFLTLGMAAHAVMKERDLARTLGVLKLELHQNYSKQKEFMARYEMMSKGQHEHMPASRPPTSTRNSTAPICLMSR